MDNPCQLPATSDLCDFGLVCKLPHLLQFVWRFRECYGFRYTSTLGLLKPAGLEFNNLNLPGLRLGKNGLPRKRIRAYC